MSVFEKARFEIWNQLQHPYKHTLSDFAYSNEAMPWVTTLEGALNAIVAANYPNTQASVDTYGDLPTVGNDPLDYRVVRNDGDGKAAGYRWEKREGDADYQWYKIYDMDWGEDTILSNFLTKTNDTYVSKKGQDDIDVDGNLLTGDLAGQYIYGGASANTNLTLFANSGDGVGSNTGFVQFGDNIAPLYDGVISLGTGTKRFNDFYSNGAMYLRNLSIIDDVISSTTGYVSTTGNIAADGDVLTTNLFTDGFIEMVEIATPASASAGANRLYFKTDERLYRMNDAGVEKLVGLELTSTNDNRLVKTDGTSATAIQESGITIDDVDAITGVTSLTVDNMVIDGNSLTCNAVATDLYINSDASVVVPELKLGSFTENAIYTPDANGLLTARVGKLNSLGEFYGLTSLDVDNLSLDGNTISSTDVDGNIVLAPNGNGFVSSKTIKPSSNSEDLGDAANLFQDVYLSGSIKDGSLEFLVSELMKLRDASTGATAGMSLFYNDVDSKWEASLPDTEIDHGTVSGLLDDDHTQYVAKDGRAGGQTVIGGTEAGNHLILSSTSNAAKGAVVVDDVLVPSSTVAEIDLGADTYRFRDLYMNGQLMGSRLQNVTTATLPTSSAANIGRAVYNTETKQIMLDNGIEWVAEGVNRYVADIVFDGVVTTKDVDVSSRIVDARNCQIQLLNNTDDFDRIYCTLKPTSASNVRIITNTPLTAGSYRLVVIE